MRPQSHHIGLLFSRGLASAAISLDALELHAAARRGGAVCQCDEHMPTFEHEAGFVSTNIQSRIKGVLCFANLVDSFKH